MRRVARLFLVLQTLLFGTLLLHACGGAQRVDEDHELPPECAAYLDEPINAETTTTEDELPDSPATLITHATVMTAAGDIFEDGYVLVEHGRIQAVGSGSPDVTLPDDLVEVDAAGGYVTPGIIDTHSHLGVYPSPYVDALSDGNEATSPTTPQVEAVDSIWPQDPGFQRAIAGGITTMQILPGSANLIGGRGVVVKLHRGARIGDEMRFPGAPETLKMACGENPKRVYGDRGQMPSTRMGSIATVRQTWIEAESYVESWDDYDDEMRSWCEAGAPEDEEPSRPSVDLASETLAGVLRGEVLPQIHCYRADEMLAQIEIADEFGFSIRSFHHAVEAYKIRDVLAEYEISVSTWADWWGFKIEAFDSILENAALVTEAGARAVIHSDSDIGIQRLNQEAAKAYYAGLRGGIDLTEDDALRWITLNAAWTLGVDDQTGSIEVGKMADLVLWDAHPFSVYAQVERVWIDGIVEYDRATDDEPWSDFELGLWPAEVSP